MYSGWNNVTPELSRSTCLRNHLVLLLKLVIDKMLCVPGCIVVPVVSDELYNFTVDVIIDVRLWYRACQW